MILGNSDSMLEGIQGWLFAGACRSIHSSSPIDVQRLSGDILSIIRGEESYGLSDILRRLLAPQGTALLYPLLKDLADSEVV